MTKAERDVVNRLHDARHHLACALENVRRASRSCPGMSAGKILAPMLGIETAIAKLMLDGSDGTGIRQIIEMVEGVDLGAAP